MDEEVGEALTEVEIEVVIWVQSISVHALSGATSTRPQAIQVAEFIKRQLIDSSSTHNFINETLA